jgi:DNA-binding LacI/PurR family transcriptional regulator
VLGLLIPGHTSALFSHAYFASIIPAIARCASERGFLLTLSTIGDPDEERRFYRQVLKGHQLDGVILLTPHMDEPLVPSLVRDRIPFVMFGRHAYLKNTTWVDVDNFEGARMAVFHLIRLGRRRIATFAVSKNEAWAIDRRDGYKNALIESGLTIEPDFILDSDNSEISGYEGMSRLLRLPAPPDAVFTPGEESALGVIRAVRDAGLSVPHDVAVVGYDDFRTSLFGSMGLTTIRQPIDAIASAAVDMLIERVERPNAPPVQKVLPVELIVRDTCGARLHGEG